MTGSNTRRSDRTARTWWLGRARRGRRRPPPRRDHGVRRRHGGARLSRRVSTGTRWSGPV